MNEIKTNHVLPILAHLEKQMGTASRVAKAIGISEAYLSDVNNGKREPGPKFLAGLTALGYRLKRVVTYEVEA